MAFSVKSTKSGVTFFLHSKRKGSCEGKSTLFFFAKTVKTDKDTEVLDALPAGYIVIESALTGLPLLKRAEPAAI
jgi:hypothetical protein